MGLRPLYGIETSVLPHYSGVCRTEFSHLVTPQSVSLPLTIRPPLKIAIIPSLSFAAAVYIVHMHCAGARELSIYESP